MNMLDVSDSRGIQNLLETEEKLRQLRKRETSVSVNVSPEAKADWDNQSSVVLWLQGQSIFLDPAVSPFAYSSLLDNQNIPLFEVSPSASLSLSNMEPSGKLTPKQIMQASKESFERFKAGREEYKRLRGKEISLLLDEDE